MSGESAKTEGWGSGGILPRKVWILGLSEINSDAV